MCSVSACSRALLSGRTFSMFTPRPRARVRGCVLAVWARRRVREAASISHPSEVGFDQEDGAGGRDSLTRLPAPRCQNRVKRTVSTGHKENRDLADTHRFLAGGRAKLQKVVLKMAKNGKFCENRRHRCLFLSASGAKVHTLFLMPGFLNARY